MSELRWNPILEEWVVTATHRQERPHRPDDQCPFCPGSGKVPDQYDVYIYPNDFPSFSTPPPNPTIEGSDFYRVEKSFGQCDVVLYHPEHTKTLAELPLEHIRLLIGLWQRRFRELATRPEVNYVLIFENKGDVIGVTIPHPHGQIYAFPFIPPKVQKRIDSAEKHYKEKKECLFCHILSEEKKDGRRIVTQNGSWIAFVPFFARFPYEVHILPKTHVASIDALEKDQVIDLAQMLKTTLSKYDGLFGFSLPYMMLMYPAPTDGREYPHIHFSIEFLPLHRAKDKLKYLAGCETGAGTFINDVSAEEKARELREVAVSL